MAKKKPTRAEIRRDAQRLLRHQRSVLAEAGSVLRAAGHEAGRTVHDEYYPRIAAESRRVARATRSRLVDDVLPGIASVIGSTVSAVDAARGRAGGRWDRAAAHMPAPRPRRGVGGFVALGIGLAVAVGVGYVIYQTFRADDELWVEEDLD